MNVVVVGGGGLILANLHLSLFEMSLLSCFSGNLYFFLVTRIKISTAIIISIEIIRSTTPTATPAISFVLLMAVPIFPIAADVTCGINRLGVILFIPVGETYCKVSMTAGVGTIIGPSIIPS